LRRAISSVSDDDIEDFTQEALVRILQNRDSFKGESRFGTWAMAVGIRVAFSALRRRRRYESAIDFDTAVVEATAPGSPGDLSAGAERRGVLRTLQRAIHEDLSDRQRRAVLGELRGIPSEALAEQLGVNRNAFYKLHHDARKKLKSAILAAGFSAQDVGQALDGE
jgi:RNA polymerase sigma-70 factor (ECF subfamily)